MADFAQAIFRFRQLNRGTYMTVFMINEDGDVPVPVPILSNFYKMLKDNEINFNNNQKYGLSYQLMKAMARKKSKDYSETNLKPEFISENLDDNALIKRLNDNTVGLSDNLLYYKKVGLSDTFLYDKTVGLDQTTNKNIQSLYEYLNNDMKRMRSIILGQGGDVQVNTQTENKVNTATENKVEKDKNTEINTLFSSNEQNVTFLKAFASDYIYTISHYNCDECINNTATKIFNESVSKIYTINDKPIYMSYNFLAFSPTNMSDSYNTNKIPGKFEFYDLKRDVLPDRWYFVEFDKYILIEIEWIALTCYADIVAVYDYNGKLINPKFSKNDLLEIHPTFKIMIGIKGSNRLERPKELEHVVTHLTQNALILMKFNFLMATRDRYNLSTELVKVLDNLTIDNIFENFKDIYVSCKNSYSNIENGVDSILTNRLQNYPKSEHETEYIQNINVKLRNQLFNYKKIPQEPIIEYKLSELKKTIIDYINKYISTIKPPVILPLHGGGRSYNSLKISYNDQYIMNKNNYIFLVRRHKQ